MDLWLYAIITPLVALVIDQALGEPPNRVHPVVWMGKLIGALDGMVPREEPRQHERNGRWASW